jgi:hypothetical protein
MRLMRCTWENLRVTSTEICSRALIYNLLSRIDSYSMQAISEINPSSRLDAEQYSCIMQIAP